MKARAKKDVEELEAIKSIMNTGTKSKFWEILTDRMEDRRKTAHQILLREEGVGMGAWKMAKAQGELETIEYLLSLPEALSRV